jgi:hypothetical protein
VQAQRFAPRHLRLAAWSWLNVGVLDLVSLAQIEHLRLLAALRASSAKREGTE